jgi:hypothetical protein
VRVARRDVRGHIKCSKTDCRRSYRSYTPSGGWNRQHASFARFSKPRDFRVFQHNLPISEVAASFDHLFDAQQVGDHGDVFPASTSPCVQIAT